MGCGIKQTNFGYIHHRLRWFLEYFPSHNWLNIQVHISVHNKLVDTAPVDDMMLTASPQQAETALMFTINKKRHHKCDPANNAGMIDGSVAGNKINDDKPSHWTKPSGDFSNFIDDDYFQHHAGCQSLYTLKNVLKTLKIMWFSLNFHWRKHFI